MQIPLIKPYITDKIKQQVMKVLESGYLTEGPVTRQFEEAFATYTGSPFAISVTSCTTGLEVALRALGIGPGDEVIVPDYTYPATASAVAITGATAVIVDIDPSTMLIDYNCLEKAITSRTKAIIPVSLFGNPLDYPKLHEIKKRHNLFMVEDAACAIGAEFKGKKVGTLADITVFSLHPRKFITTGEGGMITTNHTGWASWMNSYKHFGMNLDTQVREGIRFEITGTNYKLSNILAAIGLGQMDMIEELLAKRRQLAAQYNELVHGIPNLILPETAAEGVHSYQSYCVFTPNRDKILNSLRPKGIEVQIGTYALHMHPAFQNDNRYRLQGPFTGSIKAYEQCLTLPLYHEMVHEQQQRVVEEIKKLS